MRKYPPSSLSQKYPKVTLCQLQLCIKRTAPQTRVPEVQNLDLSGWLAGDFVACPKLLALCESTPGERVLCCGYSPAHFEAGLSAYFAHVFEKYDDFVARPKLLALCESTPPASGPKVIQKLHFVNYSYVLNERLLKPEFLMFRTSICLACWLASWLASCILHTCSRNITNSQPGSAYFAYVFEKYVKFPAMKRIVCTRVREIRRFRSSL